MHEPSKAEQVAALPAAQRAAFWAALSPDEIAALEFEWSFWARPSQLEPPGNWRTWLYCAGRGAGKTRAAAEWIRKNLRGTTPTAPGRYRRACILAETAKDARDVCVGAPYEHSNPAAGSGILQVCPPEFLPLYEPSKSLLTFPNGATCNIFNAVEYDGLRGFQFDCAWVDELAKFQYAQSAWDQLAFCLRLGQDPRVFVTTTPRPTALMKALIADPSTHVTRGSTLDNRANLAPQFIDAIMRRYEGTRLGRQEIFGDMVEDVEGALFKRSQIDACRVRVQDLPQLDRVVVAVDPAVSTTANSDETGIVCAALGSDGEFYVLDDVSGVYSPLEWAREAISLYRARRADRIVAEKNNGGDLVDHTLRNVDPNVPVTLVWAARGKVRRAEPVAALAEQGRLHICGTFQKLEDQLCSLTPDFDAKSMGFSPDRADAAIWAVTDLLEGAGTSKMFFFGVNL